jgi:hypothetical protein
MILIIGSWILAIMDLICMWMIAKHMRIAWIISAIVNTIWFPYDYLTHQYGFFLLGFVYYITYYIGWKHNVVEQ